MASKMTYYGTAETLEAAEAIITFKVITDEWRLLIPPTPLIKQHKMGGGVLLQQVGVWFILHRFHRPMKSNHNKDNK